MAMQYMPYLGLLVGNCQDVAVGDIVVLIRSEASMAQYGKWSVVDVFDGPFEVLELDPSIDQEGLMARISDPVTTQECFKAVEELRQCKVKLSIPANSKKSSWVRLGNLLPVLDASVVLRGRVEASSLYISELKAFKAYAKRLRSTSDGVTNTFKKLTLEALAGDEPPENVFGVVQLAICRFAVVLGPIDGTNDDHIERVRGKILQLVHKKSDIAVDENDLASDDDTWLKLLKKNAPRVLQDFYVVPKYEVQWLGYPTKDTTLEPRSNFPDETHIDDYDQRLDPFRDMYPFAITPLNRLVGVEGEAMLKAAHKKAAAEASKAEIAARQRGVSLAETMGVDYGNEDDDEDDDDSAAEKAKRRNESVKTTRQRSPFVDTAPTIDIPWASPLGTASRQRQITPEVELTEEQKALLPEYNAKSIKYKHMPSLAEYEMFGWDTERDDDVEAVAAEKQKEIDELNAEIRAGTAAQAAAAASAKGKAKTSSQKSADIGPSDKIPTKQSDEMGSAIPPKASAAASHSSDIAAKPSVKMPAMRFRQTAPWQPSSFGPRSSSSTAVQKTQRLMNTAPLAPYATDDDLASLKQGKNSWGPTGMAAGKKAVTTVAGGSEKSEKSTARRQAPAKITAKRTSQKAAIKSLQASSSVKRSSSTAAVEKPQPPMKKAALSVLSKAEIASLKPRRINRGPAGMAAGQKAPSATAGGSDKSKTTENASPEQSAGTTGEVVKANAETAVRAEGAVGGKQIAVVESEKGMGTKDTSADGQQSGERQKDEKEAAIRDQRGDDDDIEARLSRTLAAVGEDGWI